MEWVVLLAIFAILCVICLFKFLRFHFQFWEQICNCYLVRDYRGRNSIDDSEEISGRNSPADINDFLRMRSRYTRLREPPPDFDTAIRNSVPISYIEVEEPPPSYDDFLKSFSSQIDIESSINPCNGLVLNASTAMNSSSEA